MEVDVFLCQVLQIVGHVKVVDGVSLSGFVRILNFLCTRMCYLFVTAYLAFTPTFILSVSSSLVCSFLCFLNLVLYND